jgi:predicted TPR repeat methyltransferase
MSDPDITGYRYAESSLNQSHGYLLPAVFRVLNELTVPPREQRLSELGCGNGSVAYELTRRGGDLTGVDPSAEGIEHAAQRTRTWPLSMASSRWCCAWRRSNMCMRRASRYAQSSICLLRAERPLFQPTGRTSLWR